MKIDKTNLMGKSQKQMISDNHPNDFNHTTFYQRTPDITHLFHIESNYKKAFHKKFLSLHP